MLGSLELPPFSSAVTPHSRYSVNVDLVGAHGPLADLHPGRSLVDRVLLIF